jgi:Na+-translocating ferredoxin:NAD+ oxidoreductase RNF subunit RnfB
MNQIYYLTFPGEVTNQPIIYRLIKEFDIRVNILGGGIEADKGGFLVTEFVSNEAAIDNGIRFLKNLNVSVTRNANRIVFNESECVDCGACTAACFGDALCMNADMKLVFEDEKCISCGMCIRSCPLQLFRFI